VIFFIIFLYQILNEITHEPNVSSELPLLQTQLALIHVAKMEFAKLNEKFSKAAQKMLTVNEILSCILGGIENLFSVIFLYG
jgi:hypothetical protein